MPTSNERKMLSSNEALKELIVNHILAMKGRSFYGAHLCLSCVIKVVLETTANVFVPWYKGRPNEG